MLETCRSYSVECWKALDDVSKYVVDMPLMELITKVHNFVMNTIKVIVTWLFFFSNSSVMILGILIAFSVPDRMQEVIQSIENLAIQLIIKKEVMQITAIIIGGAFAFGITSAAISFFIGANKGVQLYHHSQGQ